MLLGTLRVCSWLLRQVALLVISSTSCHEDPSPQTGSGTGTTKQSLLAPLAVLHLRALGEPQECQRDAGRPGVVTGGKSSSDLALGKNGIQTEH